MKREYVRHLPHQIPADTPIFLTWNLKGALPLEVKKRLQREREQLRSEAPRVGESSSARLLRHHKLMFAKADWILDRIDTGPMYLREPVCAKIVEDAILFGAAERYQLLAWCVMSNHVHVVLTPVWELYEVTKGLKGYTAREINRLQGKVGRTFWVDESYDHWARDEDELLRIIHYVENNPVKAGLCQRPEDWLWSSARWRHSWPAGQSYSANFVHSCQAGKPDVRQPF